MSFLKLLGTECQKLKRSWILLLLFVPTVLTWIPSLLNADHAFQSATGAAPANEFFIQSFMGFTWFLFPACMVVCTVLLHQTELANNGITKMLSLPVRPAALSGAKFIILLGLGAVQILFCDGVYYAVAAIVSHQVDFDLVLGPTFIFKESGLMYLMLIPMMTVFWLISTLIKTPIFSIGIGLASIVPSVLMINTKIWFCYPMCYPFYLQMITQSKLSGNADAAIDPVPFLPVAIAITAVCLGVSLFYYGKAERR